MWQKKSAVALDQGFFNTLPKLKEVPKSNAEIAWLIYDLDHDKKKNRYSLVRKRIVYTGFDNALNQITRSDAGNVNDFISLLQEKLDEKLNVATAPTNQTIDELL